MLPPAALGKNKDGGAAVEEQGQGRKSATVKLTTTSLQLTQMTIMPHWRATFMSVSLVFIQFIRKTEEK